MLNQIAGTLVSLTLGSALTLTVTYFTQAMNAKSERRRVISDKLENLYALIFQLRNWSDDTRDRLWELYNSRPGTKFVPSPLECTIDKVEMLTRLCAPSLKQVSIELRDSVCDLQTVLEYFWGRFEFDDYGRDDTVLTENQYYADLINERYKRLNLNIENLASSLEKLMQPATLVTRICKSYDVFQNRVVKWRKRQPTIKK